MNNPRILSFVRSAALVALVALVACHSAYAATQYASGSLTWDNVSTAAWSATPGGPYVSQWTSGNDAVFEGTAGTVTLATPTARNLTFNTTGYTLSGASTLTLSGTTPTISLGSGITATISSVIGGGAGMTKTGVGTLTLNGANGYTGTTSVKKGTLVLDGTDGAIADPLAIYSGGTLTLNNTASYKTNRLGDGKAFASNGGIFNYNVNTSSGSFVESIGTLTLNAGALTTNTTQATSGQTSTLALASITRNAGGTALFSGTGLGTNAQNNITFTTPPTLASGIIPWALMYDGTTYDLASVSGSVLAKSTYTATGESTWTANTLNARPTGSQTLAGDRLLKTLVLDAGVNLSNPSAARKLTLGNGTTPGVIVQTGGSSTIGGTVRVQPNFATSEAIFNIIGTLTINCQATNPGMVGTGGTTKTGPGTLVLGSDSSFTFTQGGMTGALNLNEGLYEVFGSTNNALAFTDTGVTFNGGNLKLNANGSNINFNKYTPLTPITVNADGMITLDNRVSATAKAGVANTFGALTVNNSPNFTIAAGTQITSGIQQLIVGATTLNSDAIFTLNNSAAATMQLSVAAITDNGNTITLKGNGNLVQTGVWAGTGGLALDSTYTGTATLSQTNTFTGTATINGGTLKLNTATSLAAGSSVSIATSGALLNLNFSGTDTVGKLFIGGSQMADGVYEAIGNPGSGIEIAQITGTGTLTVGVVASTYTVTYSGNGSNGGSVPTDSGAYLNGATVSVRTNSGSLTKTGFVFSGWNTLANGLGTDRATSSTFTMGTANVTLYAKWVAATYTVTYNGNGSDGGSVPTDSGAYLNGATVSVLTNSGSLTKAGFVFSGWNTQADGLGTDRTASSTFAMGTANVTLYAKWIINYSSWAATYAGGGAANGDSDNDGVSNGIEYFMNITTPGFTANPTLNGSNTVTWSNGGNIPSSAYGPSGQFVVQISTDLSLWTNVPAAGDPNLSTTTGTVSYTLTGAAPLFVRLVVTPN